MSHPTSNPTYPRIDIFFGGRQAEIIKDTFALARQAIRQLQAGENVLYINTLASKRKVDEVAEALSKRSAQKILTFAESGTELAQRLEMLRIMIEKRGVRLVILNSFDFATQNSRQRLAIVQWARRLRDDHGVSLAIYMLHEPGEHGAMGQLALVADSIQQTAEWRTAPEDALTKECPLPNTTHALDEILAEIVLTYTPPTAKNAITPLIFNDLQVMFAREEEEVVEEEMEEEMEYA